MICQAGEMDEARAAEVMAESAAMLRNAGARFAYLHGSRASGRYRPDSDIDIAAYFGGQPPKCVRHLDAAVLSVVGFESHRSPPSIPLKAQVRRPRC
jgi:predicted nucleotidyltransferase